VGLASLANISIGWLPRPASSSAIAIEYGSSPVADAAHQTRSGVAVFENHFGTTISTNVLIWPNSRQK
jgi:hypothetical protein